jgi:Prealbumin-like fold domain
MGWISSLMGRRSPRTWTLLAVVGAVATATVMLIAVQAAFANHPEVSLTGSNFEIDTDANIKVDDAAPSLDWANVTEVRKADTTSGPTDESFGQGTKEDTAVPSIVDGSIPPNKSDLKFFGVYQEGNTSSGFLNLYWSRVQDPSGTTNMDFELNKRQCTPNQTPADADCSANGVTPIRSVNDVLIIYDLSQGGTHPTLSIRKWTGSQWGAAADLTSSNEATGSINTSPIPAAESDGLGAHSARTFGEAQVKLSALLGTGGTTCNSFGSAYLKSRSSDSFTAALKDFVPPAAVSIGNCGKIDILKTDDASPANPLSGAVFTLYKDNAPVGGTRGAEDTATNQTCTTGNDGKCTIDSVVQGEYWVVETTTPAGHETAADQHATVTVDATVSLTFVDPRQRGAILVTKLRKHAADGPGDHPQAGVSFTVNGVTKNTDANGKACFDNLLFGSYTVHETTPAGYNGEADKTVAVNNKAGCSDNPYVGETVTFHNTPLTNITVSVDSQVAGGTASTMNCKASDNSTVASGSTDATSGDGSVTGSNLEPDTYTCTVVVDP